MALEGGIKNLEIFINAHATINDLKDVIKDYFKNENEIMIYLQEKGKTSKKVKTLENVNEFTSFTL